MRSSHTRLATGDWQSARQTGLVADSDYGNGDRTSQRCSSCVRRAIFGLPGNPAKHCKEHRLEGELDTANKQCRHPDCARQPTYGDPAKGGPIQCKEHKLDHHVNLKKKSLRSCQHPEGATRVKKSASCLFEILMQRHGHLCTSLRLRGTGRPRLCFSSFFFFFINPEPRD